MAESLSVGQTLRQHREARGLSAEQAALQSGVPLRLLQILEADDIHLVPDPNYLVRVLHDYARLLALDPVALQAAFREATRRPRSISLAAAAPPPEKPSIAWWQVVWAVGAILIVTPLVFIVLSLASKRSADRMPAPVAVESPASEGVESDAGRPDAGNGMPNVPPEPAAPTSASDGEGSPLSMQAAPAATEQPSSGPAPVVPTPVETPSRLLLVARAVEPTWMAVRADEGRPQQVFLQKGQTARFAAAGQFVITVGNAGGVELSLNGETLAPLGRSGQVIRDLMIPPTPSSRAVPPAGTSPSH